MKNTSSLSDEIRQERARTLADKPLGYKIKYYVYYYKWYAVAVIAAILLVFSVIRSIKNNKDSALGVAIVNAAYGTDYEAVEDEFEELVGMDDKHEAQIDGEFMISPDGSNAYSMQSEEKLFMTLATGQIDIIIAPKSVFAGVADVGYVADISAVLSEDEIKEYDDIYIGHVADDSVAAVDDANAPRHDVRSGIEISDFKLIRENGWFAEVNEPIYLGFVPEGGNPENAKAFFKYLKDGS